MEYVSLKGTINSAVKVISFTPYLVRFELKTAEQNYKLLSCEKMRLISFIWQKRMRQFQSLATSTSAIN